MFIREITLKNFLSYGNSSDAIQLHPLNILIGTNGSGKSNFLEAFDLIHNAPGQIQKSIRSGGGIRNWIYKSVDMPASIEISVSSGQDNREIYYRLSFAEVDQRFAIEDEYIEKRMQTKKGDIFREVRYSYNKGKPYMYTFGKRDDLATGAIASDVSVLNQIREPSLHSEFTYLSENFENFRLYREWTFGRYAPLRQPQKTDLPNHWLEPDASNIALVLNRLRQNYEAKDRLLKALQKLYREIEDYDVSVEGGTVQVFFLEGRNAIPATRLSDGTLRYLSLLTILLHPSPPPLVCIEEPELGLHPDILPTIAELLKDASTRTQLIVTTHSDILIDAMSDMPEAVIVCEKTEQGSQLRRLDAQSLAPWLEDYRLGYLWTRGDLGGNRW